MKALLERLSIGGT